MQILSSFSIDRLFKTSLNNAGGFKQLFQRHFFLSEWLKHNVLFWVIKEISCRFRRSPVCVEVPLPATWGRQRSPETCPVPLCLWTLSEGISGGTENQNLARSGQYFSPRLCFSPPQSRGVSGVCSEQQVDDGLRLRTETERIWESSTDLSLYRTRVKEVVQIVLMWGTITILPVVGRSLNLSLEEQLNSDRADELKAGLTGPEQTYGML